MSNNLRAQVSKKIAAFAEFVESKLSDGSKARTPVDFRAMELDIAGACRGLGDDLAAAVMVDTASDPTFQADTSMAARKGGRLRIGDRRDVTVTLLGGHQVRLRGLHWLVRSAPR